MSVNHHIARVLGGNVAHVTNLQAGILPEDYPVDRMTSPSLTVEVAADIARWWIERQDQVLRNVAAREGASGIRDTNDLLAALRWETFNDPVRVLRGFL